MEKEINTNSMFFKLLKYGSGKDKYYYERNDFDTCSLTKHVLFSLVRGIIKTSMIVGAIFFVYMILYASGVILMLEFFNKEILVWWGVIIYPIISLFAVSLIGGFVALITWVVTELIEWNSNRKLDAEEKEPSATQILFKSWKEKHCSKIKFVKD